MRRASSSQPATSLTTGERRASRTLFLIGFVALAGLAFAVRFYRLGDLPPGLHYDEAFNGQDALQLVSLPLSRWPLFFTGNFGREPLLNYLLALAQAVAGPSALTLRFFPAAIGALADTRPGVARVGNGAGAAGRPRAAGALVGGRRAGAALEPGLRRATSCVWSSSRCS